MKFNMGDQTLATLVKGTDGSNQDLGSLVRQLVAASEPLESVTGGRGAVALASFKGRTDQITADLNSSLAAILEGQGGMDVAFQTGDIEEADNATQGQGQANFDGARFGAR